MILDGKRSLVAGGRFVGWDGVVAMVVRRIVCWWLSEGVVRPGLCERCLQVQGVFEKLLLRRAQFSKEQSRGRGRPSNEIVFVTRTLCCAAEYRVIIVEDP